MRKMFYQTQEPNKLIIFDYFLNLVRIHYNVVWVLLQTTTLLKYWQVSWIKIQYLTAPTKGWKYALGGGLKKMDVY